MPGIYTLARCRQKNMKNAPGFAETPWPWQPALWMAARIQEPGTLLLQAREELGNARQQAARISRSICRGKSSGAETKIRVKPKAP